MRAKLKRAAVSIISGATLAGMLIYAHDAEAERVTYYHPSYCGGGAITASGETLDCSAYTAASGTLPIGATREVCYDGCVTVRINDTCACGIDLTPAAAGAIGMMDAGVIYA